ncbi:MAG: helix-turn-helix domain-containing protein [Clostridia bacterium]|nr:helix-turn-helix domain-containing protein [Clostridia bacterium]
MSKRNHDKNNFGGFLYELRKESGMGFEEFRQSLGVSKAYLNDVETGACRPPTPEVQFKMLKILQLKREMSESTRRQFFDLAARQRNELPADVMRYLIESGGALDSVRETENYKLYCKNEGL